MRGLGAATSLQEGETIFCLPGSCMFTKNAMPARYQNLPEQCSDDSSARWSLWLADEIRKGENSPYKAWVKTFPTFDDLLSFHPALAREVGIFSERLRVGETFSEWEAAAGRSINLIVGR